MVLSPQTFIFAPQPMMLIRSLVLSAALAPTAVSADLLKIPIQKVPEEKHLAHLLASHAPPYFAAASSATGRRLVRGAPADGDAETLVLHDLGNAQYYGVVKVGTPSKEFEVVYDTGSADMWIPGKSCATHSKNCKGKHAFDETKSKSFSKVDAGAQSVFKIKYGSGDVAGTYGVDKVTLANDYTVENQTFAFVDSTDGLKETYQRSNFDGILGLAFPTISQNPGADTVVANLARAGEGMFAFYLGDESDGELAIGGYNEDKMKGQINWVDLRRAGYWLVTMDSVKFGEKVITGSPTGGIMDTGTSLIYGPQDQVEAMLDEIGGGKLDPKIGLYEIHCDADIPDLKFSLGGKAYTIPGDALGMIDPGDDLGFYDDVCYFSVAVMAFLGGEDGTQDEEPKETVVQEMTGIAGSWGPVPGEGPIPFEYMGDTWLMGDTFLRQYYTIYDYDKKRFGLADLKLNQV